MVVLVWGEPHLVTKEGLGRGGAEREKKGSFKRHTLALSLCLEREIRVRRRERAVTVDGNGGEHGVVVWWG